MKAERSTQSRTQHSMEVSGHLHSSANSKQVEDCGWKAHREETCLEDLHNRWKDNIKVDLNETKWEGVE